VQEKMVLKFKLPESIPQHVQGLNYGEGIYESEDHVGEEALSSNLLPRLGLVKKFLPAGFPNQSLESA
jgi:hypothetical protein